MALSRTRLFLPDAVFTGAAAITPEYLRENGIRPASARDLGRRLRQSVGREVTLTLWTQYGSTERLPCRVLDSDESWALLLRSEGKKQQRQVLIRLEDVKDVKLTAPGGGKKKEEQS